MESQRIIVIISVLLLNLAIITAPKQPVGAPTSRERESQVIIPIVPQTANAPTQDRPQDTEDKPTYISLGEFRVTVYTPYCDGGKWGYKTATGVKSEHLKTCAVDPKVIPLGSVLKIGNLELKAVDTGSAVKGKVIDIFYDGTIGGAKDWLKGFGTSREIFKEVSE